MSRIRESIKTIGAARLIIITFLIFLVSTAAMQGQNMQMLGADALTRFGMNLILALAMMPAVMSGTGMNFGLPIGILCGMVGGLLSIEFEVVGIAGILFSMGTGIIFATVTGYLYGKLLNAVKGSEMMIGTYVGYSVVSLMCIAWLLMPFRSKAMVWPISGKGLRNTISLENNYSAILDNFLRFEVFGIKVPTGMIIFGLLACLTMYLFSKSKTGIALQVTGDNPRFAASSGISVDKSRIIGTVLSTALGAIGIIVYAQSFGFFQLYQAPLNMAFAPVAAVLLGGASTSKIRISHVIIGTALFQSLLTVSLPVMNLLMPEGNLSEVVRIIVSNGIILYALSQAGGADNE